VKPNPEADAYVVALRLLARRELSEAQLRQRLTRKGYLADAVETAVARLRDERALDDARVAEAIAHTGVTVHRRGRLRVKRDIEHAGIAAATARHAVDTVFGGLDDDALLETALARRLRGRERVADERELRRLYRYLLGQGFEPERAAAALRKRKPL
jgi:regulatory protein